MCHLPGSARSVLCLRASPSRGRRPAACGQAWCSFALAVQCHAQRVGCQAVWSMVTGWHGRCPIAAPPTCVQGELTQVWTELSNILYWIQGLMHRLQAPPPQAPRRATPHTHTHFLSQPDMLPLASALTPQPPVRAWQACCCWAGQEAGSVARAAAAAEWQAYCYTACPVPRQACPPAAPAAPLHSRTCP
jgi:hypothetical protein